MRGSSEHHAGKNQQTLANVRIQIRIRMSEFEIMRSLKTYAGPTSELRMGMRITNSNEKRKQFPFVHIEFPSRYYLDQK